jgi:hypothetical protein
MTNREDDKNQDNSHDERHEGDSREPRTFPSMYQRTAQSAPTGQNSDETSDKEHEDD